MVSVGERIRLTLNKGAGREGVVTGLSGSMLRVRWASGEESNVVPGPGTLVVLGPATRGGSRPRPQTSAAAKKAASRKTASKAATKVAGPKKAAPKKSPSKTTATKSAGASNTGRSKRQPPAKRAGRGQKSTGGRRSS